MRTKRHELSDDVVVESHPPRRRATASEELLDDTKTAPHYFAGVREIEEADPHSGKLEKKQVVGVDSLGKPIKLGEEMDYIDWYDRNHDWTVYKRTPVPQVNNKGEEETVLRLLPQGTYDTEAEALRAAAAILEGGAS